MQILAFVAVVALLIGTGVWAGHRLRAAAEAEDRAWREIERRYVLWRKDTL